MGGLLYIECSQIWLLVLPVAVLSAFVQVAALGMDRYSPDSRNTLGYMVTARKLGTEGGL